MESPVSTKAAILAALMRGKSYGLEIIDKVRDRTDGTVILTEGNVYPKLREMERDGLLRSFDGDPTPERGGRPRRYYELTGEGRRAATDQRTAVIGLMDLHPSEVV